MTIAATTVARANASWQWNDYSLPYRVEGDRHAPAVVLIHGFGGCIGHWRKTVADLSQQYRVYAIDLLGFGAAPKPAIDYTFELWGEQLSQFCQQVVGQSATYVGNSVGCIVALQAAKTAPDWCTSVVLINCSLRLLHDSKREDLSWIQRVGTPIVQRVLKWPPVGNLFFGQIAQRRSLRNILKQAYRRHETITDELLDLLLEPAREPGAADVFISFINYSSGPLAEEILPQLTLPVAILWGEDDPWEPLELARSWEAFDCVQQFATIPNAGHCPMDEAWEETNALLRDWLQRVEEQSLATEC
ncbi:MAG: alpha/beta fold hydrolase [Cyanobacteria bacterium P01_A01_bin.3]